MDAASQNRALDQIIWDVWRAWICARIQPEAAFHVISRLQERQRALGFPATVPDAPRPRRKRRPRSVPFFLLWLPEQEPA